MRLPMLIASTTIAASALLACGKTETRTVQGVPISAEKAELWSQATLGQDLGRYAFRPWSFQIDAKPGKNTVMVSAANKIGQTQTATLLFNGAGYHNNVMQNITLNAA